MACEDQDKQTGRGDWEETEMAGRRQLRKTGTVHLRLGIEPTWQGLEPGQHPQNLLSGPSEAQVLGVSSQKEFSERQSDS